MGGFFIDQDDNLYMANGLQDIGIFRHASALEGDVEPDLILTVPDAETVGRLVVGSDGTGYIADRWRSTVYVYQDIANCDGEMAPDGTIEGWRTGLSGPTFLALYEPQE
jgi:hypothetical protein